VDCGNIDLNRMIRVVTVPTMSKVALKLYMSPAQTWQERHSGDSNPVPVPGACNPDIYMNCCRTHHTEASSASLIPDLVWFAQPVVRLAAGTHCKKVALPL
jgi:hypothetical protein